MSSQEEHVDHSGSTFDSFLEEEGILREVTAAALNRVAAWQATQTECAPKAASRALPGEPGPR
ncbi:MAG: hypothetical protein ACRD19_09610 [Terriglobia bacterium]